MFESRYGPRKDWQTFTLRTEGKGLREFKAGWYNLCRKEGVCTDMIVCFKSGEVKLVSSNIYWGKTGNPKNYKYYIDGLPAGRLFSQIDSVDMMHPLFNHPQCADFWKKDADGSYSSFDFEKARPVMDQIMVELLRSAPNDRFARDVSCRRGINCVKDVKPSLCEHIQAAKAEESASFKGCAERKLERA